jgi:hypothetical protein
VTERVNVLLDAGFRESFAEFVQKCCEYKDFVAGSEGGSSLAKTINSFETGRVFSINHRLGEEVCGQGQIQRRTEADRPLSTRSARRPLLWVEAVCASFPIGTFNAPLVLALLCACVTLNCDQSSKTSNRSSQSSNLPSSRCFGFIRILSISLSTAHALPLRIGHQAPSSFLTSPSTFHCYQATRLQGDH